MKGIINVSTVVNQLINEGTKPEELMEAWNISRSMISNYVNAKANPNLRTAISIYKDTKIAVHPYSKQSILQEIKDETTRTTRTT